MGRLGFSFSIIVGIALFIIVSRGATPPTLSEIAGVASFPGEIGVERGAPDFGPDDNGGQAPPALPPAAPIDPPNSPGGSTVQDPASVLPGPVLQPMEQRLFDAQNGNRSEYGVASLRVDGRLTVIARARASDMASNGYFSHTSPTGATAYTLLDQAGYGYEIAGENISRNNYPDGRSVDVAMNAFMNSPSHRENALEPRFHNVGIGVAVGSGGMKYYAVVFTN